MIHRCIYKNNMTQQLPLFIIILALIFPQSAKCQAQQYTVGIPVNDTLYYLQPYSQSGSCMFDVEVFPNIFSITGVELYMVIDTLIDVSGNTLVIPGANINIGDTLFLPSSSASGGYQFKFNGGSGSSALCRLMARGTPTVAGESYLCDNYATIMTSAICQNSMSMMGATSCQVAASTVDLLTENDKINYTIYPNPASISLTIDAGSTLAPFHVKIYSCLGVLVKEMNSDGLPIQVDIHELPIGLYTIAASNQKRLLFTEKIIIH